MPICKAYQVNDQMLCGQCGLQWDVNDPEPPGCQPVDLAELRTRQRTLLRENDIDVARYDRVLWARRKALASVARDVG